MNPIVYTTKPDPNSLPGFWEPKMVPTLKGPTLQHLDAFTPNEACIIKNVLSADDCKMLIGLMNCSPNFEEVGVQGMKDKKDERIGSLRTSIWTPSIAQGIWDKIHHFLPEMYCNSRTATDWWQGLNQKHSVHSSLDFEPTAISPLLRFMKYGNGGQHYAHYDASFIYPNKLYRSLKSMVIYLTTNEGAATRFIQDGQESEYIWNRKFDDWSRPVEKHEIISKSECIAGNVLIFNHRICHDVEQYLGNDDRIIIRGDIIYKVKGAR